MPRTTPAAVRSIAKIKASITDAALAVFIEAANSIVTRLCLLSGYDDPTLELIERWLAAHFYHVFDPRRVDEKVDVLSATYEGKSGMNLNFTRYGQQAMLLDTAGNLAMLQREITQGRRVIKGTIAYIGGNRRNFRGIIDPLEREDRCL